MKRFTNNLIANFIGRGWALIATVIFVPFYIKFLGVEAYGLVGFYASLQGVLMVADMGLTATLNRELARLSTSGDNAGLMRNTTRTIESIYCAVLVVVSLVVIGASHYIAYYWVNAKAVDPQSVQAAVRLMGIAMSLQLMFSLYQGGMIGLQRQVQLNVIFVVMGIVRSVGVILALWLIAPTIEVFFIWQASANLVQLIWIRAAVWHSIPKCSEKPCFDLEIVRTVWRYAAGMMGMTITASILRQADKIVLSKMLPLEVFGYYTIAWTVAQTPISVLTTPVYQAVFPRLTQEASQGNVKETSELYHRSSQLVTALSAPATLVLSFFAAGVLHVWLGNKPGLEYTAKMLQILVIGHGLMGILTIPSALQLAYGWTSLGFYVNIGQIMFIIPLMVALVHFFGAIGACVTWVLLNIVVLLVYMRLLHNRYLKDELRQWYLGDVALPSTAAFVSVILLWLVIPEIHSRPLLLMCLAGVWLLSSAATFMFSSRLRPLVRRVVSSRFGVGKAVS